MRPRHRHFLVDMAARLGPPMLAASTVGCLLSGRFEPIHGILMATGVGLSWLGHLLEYHPAESAG